MTFRVYDEDVTFDELRYEGTTGTNGSFDVTLVSESEPDIYAEFETLERPHHTVEDASLWENNYFFETIRHTNFTGSEIALRHAHARRRGHARAPHLHQPRARVALVGGEPLEQRGPPRLPLSGSHVAALRLRHAGDPHALFGRGQAFRWSLRHPRSRVRAPPRYQFQDPSPSDYDNGICNRADGKVRDTGWCTETGATAINEGWPNW